MKILISQFKQFRIEKNTIKTIKHKSETIALRNSEEWNIFDKVCKALAVDEDKKEKINLRYKKQKMLDLDKLKQISAPRLDLK